MKNKIYVILFLAFFIRILLIILFKSYLHPEVWEFEQIINNLLSGKGFLYYHMGKPYWSVNTPFYSFLSAGIYLVASHNYFAMFLTQIIFSLLLIYIVFAIGRIIFSEKIGFLSSVFTAFHPGFVYYDVFKLVPLSIDSFFVTFSVFLFLKFKENPNKWKFILMGTIIGLGALSRGIIGVILPISILYVLLFSKSLSLHKRIIIAFSLIVGTYSILSPWIIRNYIIHKEFIIVSTIGEAFWRGNNKYATGSCLTKNNTSILNLWPEDFRNKVDSLDEIHLKKFFLDEAMGFIKDNPLDFIKLYVKKLYYFWWFSPQSGTLYPLIYLYLYKYIYIFFLLFFVFGIIAVFNVKDDLCKGRVLVVLFVTMAICLFQSLFYVEGRHRWIVEPLMSILSAYGALKFYYFLPLKQQ